MKRILFFLNSWMSTYIKKFWTYLCWGLFLLCCFSGVGFAADWNLPGVDIISRADRWAQDSWRLEDHPYYDWWELNIAEYELWQEWTYADTTWAFQKQQDSRQKYEVSNAWILKRNVHDLDFQDFSLEKRWPYADGIVKTSDGKTLRRPQTYKDKKTKIVIHHTASFTPTTRTEAESYLQELQVQHTFSNWRWDIGYNFLIDSQGNIYEWRAWGAWVIWAHAKRNNAPSVGIALIWDFEKEKPTQKMLTSLTELTTSLSWTYDIYPYTQQSYYFPIDTSPYIEAHQLDSLVGHTHIWTTSCPGDFVISYIPQLKKNVQVLLQYFRTTWSFSFDDVEFLSDSEPVRSSDDEAIVKIPFDSSGNVSCEVNDTKSELVSCTTKWRVVYMKLKRTWYAASGTVSFQITDLDQHRVWLWTAVLVREKDLSKLQQLRKLTYIDTYGSLTVPARSEKVSHDIFVDDIQRLEDISVDVLLYELTTWFREWTISCQSGCDLVMNEQKRVNNVSAFDIVAIGDNLTVTIGNDQYQIQSLDILNKSIITVQNYGRASFAWIPWNRFRGNLTFQKEQYRHLDNGWVTDWVVVNSLDVYDYRAGVAETNDQDHIEKVKAILLAVKNYTLHYIEWKNLHPSVPADAIYTMIDDPRMMQKYVWYGYEQTVTSWFEALRSLSDTWVTYRDQIVILPYYHCGWWFTRSGKEKFGRVDTPWLQSRLDIASCDSGKFSWHGVGMSGNWAARLAEAGVKADEIIRWFYTGVEVK